MEIGHPYAYPQGFHKQFQGGDIITGIKSRKKRLGFNAMPQRASPAHIHSQRIIYKSYS